ncbi:MAG: DUF2145 domain-containing protein, partial [Burkholderiaceae bacterium]
MRAHGLGVAHAVHDDEVAACQRTARALDASGAQVVVLGRAGQDLSKYGLRYSHLGWAYKTPE